MKVSDHIFTITITWMLSIIILVPILLNSEQTALNFQLGIGGYVIGFIIYALIRRKEDKKEK